LKTRYSAEPCSLALGTFGLLGISAYSIYHALSNDKLAYDQAFSHKHRSQRAAEGRACNPSRHSLCHLTFSGQRETIILCSRTFLSDLQSSLGGIPPHTPMPSCCLIRSFPALPRHASSDDIVHDNVDGIRVVFISVEVRAILEPWVAGISFARQNMFRKRMSNAWRE
jgi:hypothetical protein